MEIDGRMYAFVSYEDMESKYDWADVSEFISDDNGFWCPDDNGNGMADFIETGYQGPDVTLRGSEESAGG